MKLLALDVGDAWTGSALSDALRITASPYQTVATDQLQEFLKNLFEQEEIAQVIVGYPKTMSGTESEQTKKIVAQKKNLEKLFPDQEWTLWDERLSSKRAEQLKKSSSKKDKLQRHSVAAAFILDSYLNYLAHK